MADRVNLTLTVRKRWFFWPAMLTIVALGKVGVLKDIDKAAKWLADNAMRLEVV